MPPLTHQKKSHPPLDSHLAGPACNATIVDSMTALSPSPPRSPPASWVPHALLRFEPNPAADGRDMAVGDVHGCFSLLQKSLDAAGFDPARDRLFCAGDLVDRGPESPEALDWLRRPWVFSCMGNHDFMAWRRAEGRPYAMVDHLEHGGEWLDELDADQKSETAAILRDLPIALEVPTVLGPVGIVHADFPYDDWAQAAGMKLVESARFGDLMSCLWGAGRYEARYEHPIKGVRALLQGHICIHETLILGNVHYIDTGGWRDGGRFTLLDLATLEPACRPASPSRRSKAKLHQAAA